MAAISAIRTVVPVPTASISCRSLKSAARSSVFRPSFVGNTGAIAIPAVPRSAALSKTCVRASYTNAQEGESNSLEFRLFIKSGDKTVSPWHDIPLFAKDGVCNMIVEIPKETSAKMEVATDEPGTPIKQDVKKGKLRFYPYNINWNYGMLPQTWEDPKSVNHEVDGAAGDNDPVDVVEIGGRQAKMGEVIQVKPLAVLAMIDEGELDWKVVCLDVNDPKADKVHDMADVEREFPGVLQKIKEWFRDYKIPDGKPANKFGLGEKPQDKAYAMKVIHETNHFWKKLVLRERANTEELSLM
eukprot:jgi/Mesvir1/16140/Mv08414-RA.1